MAQKKTFEHSMKQLEQIVTDLESGEISIEKALKLFEEGTKLSKACSKKLYEMEKKISLLTNDSKGNLSERPFFDNKK